MAPRAPFILICGKISRALNDYSAITCRQSRQFELDSNDGSFNRADTPGSSIPMPGRKPFVSNVSSDNRLTGYAKGRQEGLRKTVLVSLKRLKLKRLGCRLPFFG